MWDRETPIFVPPVLREWVADNELPHLAFKAVEFSESARGTAQCTGQRKRAISSHHDAGARNLFLCNGSHQLTPDRAGDLRQCDGALFVRQSSPDHCEVGAGERGVVSEDKDYDNTEQIVAAQCEHVLLVLCPPQRRHNAREHKPRRKGHLARQRTRAQAGPLRSVSLGFSFERSPEPLAVSFFLSSALG